MASVINDELAAIIAEKETSKVLATVGKEGIPHAVTKGSIRVNQDGNLEYWELLEGSQTNKNLVYSLWFDKKVAVTITAKDKRSFLIVGKPVKTIVAGRKFQEEYEKVQKIFADSELAAIWIIEPEQVKEETYAVRRKEETVIHPYYVHLDSLAKE